MEVLINIIITVVIILYVLKRMQEVARKGGDITGPPPPARMFGEEEEEEAPKPERPMRIPPEATQMPKRVEIPSMPTLRPRPVAQAPASPRTFTVPGEPPRPRPRAVPEATRPRHRHIEAPAETAPSREERIREVVRENEEGRYMEAVTRSGAAAPGYATHRKKACGRQPLFAFGRNDVVRGIVMSEILGPPVSMRREASR
jgi:hypothetical protein